MSVPLTFNGVIAILNTAVNRPDIASQYPDYINRAIRDTAVAHSFNQMQALATVTIPSGQAEIDLPDDWKEPQNGRYWAFAAIGAAAKVAIPVYSRMEMERLAIAPQFLPNPYLLYTQDDDGFQVGFFPPNVAPATYIVDVYYFAYPAVVIDLATGTPLLTFYPNVIIEKTLSLIFQDLNDPIWKDHEAAWKDELGRVTDSDIGASNAAPRPDKG